MDWQVNKVEYLAATEPDIPVMSLQKKQQLKTWVRMNGNVASWLRQNCVNKHMSLCQLNRSFLSVVHPGATNLAILRR